MSLTRRAHPRLPLAAAALAVVATVVFAVIAVGPVRGVAGGESSPQPILGPALALNEADLEGTMLMGASSESVGEAWAIGFHPAGMPVPTLDGTPLEFEGSPGNAPQTVFYRHTAAMGWQAVDTPRKTGGAAYRQLQPVHESTSITPQGGGAVLGIADGQPRAFIRDPGGSFTESIPPADVLLPAERIVAGSGDRGPAAAYDAPGGTGLFAAATGGAAETVIHFDGDQWVRETVEYPSGMDSNFRIRAISVTGVADAWMAADNPTPTGRGLMIFKRNGAGVWQERSLGASKFADSTIPADGVTDVDSLASTTATVGTDPLTATDDGVWIDGKFEVGGETRTFTVFYDDSAGAVTGSWCDAVGSSGPVCNRPLGGEFNRGFGYRSTAWSGAGLGTRVISNPVEPGTGDRPNYATYLKLAGDDFLRVPAAGYDRRVSTALFTDSKGFITPETELTADPKPARLASWAVGSRSPFVDAVGEPGKPVGSIDSRALAVGEDGGISRYIPSKGWLTEYLQTANGLVTRPDLRAVAWPEAARAHAVGNDGSMWLWRAENNLWQRDPGAPVGIETHLMDIAFNPNDAEQGYVVGREGTLLKYGKSWERVCVNPGDHIDCGDERLDAEFADTTIRAITFAGGEPIAVAGSDVLVRQGGVWKADPDFRAMIADLRAGINGDAPELLTVAGLPDGGAFVGGDGGFAFKRENASAPWISVAQPLKALAITSSALFREAGELRVLVTTTDALAFPPLDPIGPAGPGQPQPFLRPLEHPADGFLLRETATGWRDETRSAFSSPIEMYDRPAKVDTLRGLLIGADGNGWAVGGNLGQPDWTNSGSDNSTQRNTVRTAMIARYESQGATASSVGSAAASQIPQNTSSVNFMVGGHASCASRVCSYGAYASLAPDRQLAAAVSLTARLSTQSNGPRFFMYTGGRLPEDGSAAMPARELQRLSGILGVGGLPAFAAVSSADSAASDVSAFRGAFESFGAPFGTATPGPGVSPRGSASGTRTHYSFDSEGQTGRVRVIVIDNSRGSLAASDPHQNPPVASQESWLVDELRAAKSDGIPAVVVGSRDLNENFSPKLNVASDGTRIARLLRDEGASAYFFERPEENRQFRIPAGEADSIPAFGTGTLGYRAEQDVVASDTPSRFFGDTGTLLASVDVAARDAVTNRAPVSVKLIPLIESLNIDAIDGTEIRRSRTALFEGLGRKPVAGDRWGTQGPDSTDPAGSSPYTTFPVELCQLPGCDTRIDPDFVFTSSDPDIADFVQRDPASSNLRKPFLSATGKTTPDAKSGLLCAFNAGTTTVSVSSGGFTYSRQITILDGSVRPPCGTVPLRSDRFVRQPSSPGVPPASPPPAAAPPIALALPPAPLPPNVPQRPVPPAPIAEFAAIPIQQLPPRVVPPPPPPSLARPIPPTGGMSRVFEEKREEEAATEDSQAFARHYASEPPNVTWTLAGAALALALGLSTFTSRRGRPRTAQPAMARATRQPLTAPPRRSPR